jgi:hypothetical protein
MFKGSRKVKRQHRSIGQLLNIIYPSNITTLQTIAVDKISAAAYSFPPFSFNLLAQN